MLSMRKKIGTVLEQRVIDQARRAARSEGKSLAAYIEEALVAHLDRRERISVGDLKGMFRLTPEELNEVLQADLYDP